ncbi:hypothetical protein BD309DRAFT_679867 [Dichomitus squalens]|nr:hypothetical protein BD309DRAFT_679867 [Dichomitus squalens]
MPQTSSFSTRLRTRSFSASERNGGRVGKRACESCHTVHKRCVGPLPCERCRKAGRAEQCFEHKRQKHDWSSLVQSTSCSPTLPTSSFLSAGEAPSLDVVLDQEEFLSGPPEGSAPSGYTPLEPAIAAEWHGQPTRHARGDIPLNTAAHSSMLYPEIQLHEALSLLQEAQGTHQSNTTFTGGRLPHAPLDYYAPLVPNQWTMHDGLVTMARASVEHFAPTSQTQPIPEMFQWVAADYTTSRLTTALGSATTGWAMPVIDASNGNMNSLVEQFSLNDPRRRRLW